MLIVLLGLPLAGKSAVARRLIDHEGFTRVRLATTSTSTAYDKADLVLPDAAAFLDYATEHWRTRYVTTDLGTDPKIIDAFRKRPWVLLVSVEAPLGVRFNRATQRAKERQQFTPTLEDFVAQDDLVMYGHASINDASSLSHHPARLSGQTLHLPSGSLSLPPPAAPFRTPPLNGHISGTAAPLAPVLQHAHLTLYCAFPTLDELHAHLDEVQLTQMERLRPSWDDYFMLLAELASLRSNCMKRRVGAVIVSNKHVVSTGYNGTPRGMRNCAEGGCPRCNAGAAAGQMLEECVCLHAEENALLEAGRERAGAGGDGSVLYCNTCPCLRCSVKIVQCGIREVVYSLSYSVDSRSADILTEGGVKLRQIRMPTRS